MSSEIVDSLFLFHYSQLVTWIIVAKIVNFGCGIIIIHIYCVTFISHNFNMTDCEYLSIT